MREMVCGSLPGMKQICFAFPRPSMAQEGRVNTLQEPVRTKRITISNPRNHELVLR
jgi:hypothetical protein